MQSEDIKKSGLWEDNKLSRMEISCQNLLSLYFHTFKGCLLEGLIHNVSSPLLTMNFVCDFLKKDLVGLKDAELGSVIPLMEKVELLSKELASVTAMLEDFKLLDQMIFDEDGFYTFQDVVGVLQRVLKADLFFKHHIKLEIDIDDPFIRVPLPFRYFIPVFVELVRNAISALRLEEADKRMVFYARSSLVSGKVIVGVGDNGCGWGDEADSSLFFKPWFSRWSRKEGPLDDTVHLGLGLYCARNLLEYLNCEIKIFRQNSLTWVHIFIPSDL